MRQILHYGLTLSLICVLASSSLSVMNLITQPRIIAQEQSEEESSLKEVVPEAVDFEPAKSRDEIIYYKAYNKDRQFIGVVFKTLAKGYSSTIETMVGMKKDGRITSIKILNQNETPGLGARVTESSFTGQFFNKDIHGLDGVQAITGATISSKAVIDSVRKKIEEIRILLQNEK